MFKKALASALIAISLSMVAFSSHAAIREGRVVYDDGTVQNLYPAVLYPEIFISLAESVEGVSNVVLNVDYSFSFTFEGGSYYLYPMDGFINQSLDVGQYVAPSISSHPSNPNIVLYSVQSGSQYFTFSLFISL